MSRIRPPALLIGAAAAVIAGGCGGNRISLSGKTSAEQALTIARTICREPADCGKYRRECAMNGSGTIDCYVVHEAIDYATCVSDNTPGIQEDLDCAMLTPAQLSTLEDCLNGLQGRSCPTDAQVQAFEDAVANGEDPPPPGDPLPAACDALDTLFSGCGGGPPPADAGTPSDAATPTDTGPPADAGPGTPPDAGP